MADEKSERSARRQGGHEENRRRSMRDSRAASTETRKPEDPLEAAHHVIEREVNEGEATAAPDPDQKNEPGGGR